MADRELQTILSSGEVTSIYIGGVASTHKVQVESDMEAANIGFDDTGLGITAVTAQAALADVDGRLVELEESHTLLIFAASTASTQEPTAVDTPLQIEFGPIQTTTDISVAADGSITFNTAGKYIVSPFFQYGRTGASGTSVLLNRYLRNGTQEGKSLAAKIDNANTLVPWSSSIQFTAAVNDVLTIEIMRDSTGDNSGGLFSIDPTVVGWDIAPCASIQIYKAT